MYERGKIEKGKRSPCLPLKSSVFSGEKVVEGGFSLIETTIALVFLMVALLGVFTVFTYSIMYNTGNNIRSQALSVLQQETEMIRSAKFTPSITDETLLGGEKAPRNVTTSDNNTFRVQIKIDDDPLTSGIQINSAKTLKEITITVTPQSATATWQTVLATTVVIRRVRSN